MIDDVEQMVATQNELKRRGAPEIIEEQIETRAREHREERERWRAS